MRKETKTAVETYAVSHAKHVVRVVIIKKVGNGRVQVATPKNDQHVIDEVVHIEEILIGRIERAIRVESLNFEIIGVAGKTVCRCHPQTGPGIHVSVRRENRVASASVHLDDIVLLLVAAKITCPVGGLGSLVGVVKAPILPVNV